jgi:hypothetical protein
VGPRPGLNAVAKRKIPSHCWESNHDRPAGSLTAILYNIPHTGNCFKQQIVDFIWWVGSTFYDMHLRHGPIFRMNKTTLNISSSELVS